jgi:ABC-type polysaccharide/polyol phosphate transport system ATPase subunit
VSRGLGDRPVVIEARDVAKTFRVPLHRVDSLKERATHPLARQRYRELRALDGVSFDVHQGEFFGIVGRNGSGKSTLLKIMASIYRADAGRVRMAGRLAPFIELGVGFNPELTARDNVVLNGVLMGLTRHEAQGRYDAVLEFAELQEFAELKLKNYSSGMMVRLAFAVMVQADADIMLIDEVLAVGDAAFAQKCMDVFHERRDAGKTVVLVTHDMATVQSMCDRAMLIHESELVYVGDPDETALRYFRLNFAGGDAAMAGNDTGTVPDVHTRIVEARLVDGSGQPVENVEQGQPIGLQLLLEARRELEGPLFGVTVTDAEGTIVFSFKEPIADRVEAGQRVRIAAEVENPLLPGRYSVDAFVYRRHESSGALQKVRLLDFVVYGTGVGPGMVSVRANVQAVLEG